MTFLRPCQDRRAIEERHCLRKESFVGVLRKRKVEEAGGADERSRSREMGFVWGTQVVRCRTGV